MYFDKLKINYELILSKMYKMVPKPTRRLDYAILKFTSSTPVLDYAIPKLWSTHTTVAPYDAPFPPEHAGINIVTLRRKMAEL